MKEMEKNMMCVLLQTLLNKKLITQDICEKAKTKVLGTLDIPNFFCCSEGDEKEGTHEHTQNSC